MKFLEVFAIGVIVTNVILYGLYGFSLFKMCKGTNYKLFKTLIVLLIVACIFRVLNLISGIKTDTEAAKNEDFMPWGTVNAISYPLEMTSFIVAHWLFAFEYFVMAESMPLALQGIQLAASTHRAFRIVKVSGVGVIVLLSIATGFIFYFAFLNYYRANFDAYNQLKQS